MTTTIFLRLPAGVAIETEDFVDAEELLDLLGGAGRYLVVSRRTSVRHPDEAELVIPIDNIASIEVR
jgi:hypothetical protein